jgi:hypothetical protein
MKIKIETIEKIDRIKFVMMRVFKDEISKIMLEKGEYLDC